MEREFSVMLKDIRLKATPKRLAILHILDAESGYMGPDEVWQRLKERFTRIGLPTVYRNLEDLARSGILIKIIHPDRKLYYYLCRNTDHHHHFICVSCRKVEDLTYCGAREIEEEVKRNLRGHVISHIMQVFGLCDACATAKTMST